MRWGILGPLSVIDDAGTEIRLPTGRLRTLVAALLTQANHVVSVDELVEFVWDGAPPADATRTMRVHVVRLRHALGPSATRIITRSPGYMCQVGEDELDVLRFGKLCRLAGSAARDETWERAADLLAEALDLWRGTPLADVPSDLLRQRELPRLDGLRLQAIKDHIDAEMHLRRYEQLIPRLRTLTAEYPLHEHLHTQLMRALACASRRAEALDAYQHARRVLVEQLGIEPGPELRDLHQRVLNGETEPATVLAATGPGRAAEAEPRRVTPRELPPAAPGFTGRSAELRALTQLLDRTGEHAPGVVAISAIGGAAGVGKTALAVHWAHQVAGRFPDGQLYVNLRGYDPGQPMAATDALAGFLRSLGVPGQDIPPESDQRAARYRSLLAGQQMLIVLDNAGSADQVRPLMPSTPACTVLVTSRDTLAGLVARDGAARLDLDVLPLAEAIALLRTLIGARVDAEPAAAAELAGQCCRLPLALRVAAELAVSRPAVPLAGLAGELADLRTRLDLLAAGGDPRTEVRTVFSWSYHHLGAEDARTFRLLGLHPGPDSDPYGVAALTAATMPQARRALDVLARAHLIQPAAPGRYGMHDLLRGYARELTAARDQHAALTCLFDHYLHTAAVAMDTLYPAERHRRPRIPCPATPVPPLPDPAAARDWLDRERAAMVAAAAHAGAHDWPGHATRLATTLSSYLFNGGHLPEARTIFSHALGAARRTGDRTAEAKAHNQIGRIDWQQGRYQQAADHHRQALALCRQAGDRGGEADTLINLGLCETELGSCEQAACHQQEAAAIHRDIGDRFGNARALGNLGHARQRQGRYQEAAGYHRQALDLSREIGDSSGEGYALARLGYIDLRLGRYEPAAEYLQQALDLFHKIGGTVGESEILVRLGQVYLGLGRYEQAAGDFKQALAIIREVGDPVMEADALNSLGDVLVRTGDTDQARGHHATALRLASQAGAPMVQARAHSGLASGYHADGDPARARHHWEEALSLYTATGAPEADEIRARLASAGNGAGDGGKRAMENGGTTARPPR
jgi:DNA-binding SARP family transcriptional activator/Tfp pilus assembly protein PilF